jgi:hypothetical protein
MVPGKDSNSRNSFQETRGCYEIARAINSPDYPLAEACLVYVRVLLRARSI